MGAGKSTVGRALSRTLNLPFYDIDQEIEKRCGADIPRIFDVEGEEGFRQRETALLETLAHRQNLVVATGGGIVQRAVNRELMKASGVVVFLQASLATQIQRTAKDKKRPLLMRSDRTEVLADLYRRRKPLYQGLADLIVCANYGSHRQVVRDILARLKSL